MKFLIDVQLLKTLARWLRGRGYDAEHVLEREMGQTVDLMIWKTSAFEGGY